jgi:hypothetical protein
MNQTRNKFLLFAMFAVVLIFFSVFVYLYQNQKIGIFADTDDALTYNKVMDNISLRNVYNFTTSNLFVIDKYNNPHVLAGDKNHNLVYFTKKNNQWEKHFIEDNQSVPGGYGHIAITNDGSPYIAYQLTGGKLKLKYFIQNQWKIDHIEGFNLERGHINGLVVDSKNQPYILYQPEVATNMDKVLIYKDNDLGIWNKININSSLAQNQNKILMSISNDVLKFAYIPIAQYNPRGDNNTYIEIASYSLQDKIFNNVVKIYPADIGLSQNSLFSSINNLEVYKNNYHLLAVVSDSNSQQEKMYYINNKSGDWIQEDMQNLFGTQEGFIGSHHKTIPVLALDPLGNPSLIATTISGSSLNIDYLYKEDQLWKRYTKVLPGLAESLNRCVLKIQIDKKFLTNVVFSCITDIYENASMYYMIGNILTPRQIEDDSVPTANDHNSIKDEIDSQATQTAPITKDSQSAFVSSGTKNNLSNNDIKSVRSLVATGSSFWLNLIVSLIMIIGVGYLIFRREIHRENK